jgi:2-dehydro-3-deoxy-D-pentonate aldolase
VGDGNGASGNGSRSNGARMNANRQVGQQAAWNWDDALRGVVPPMITPLDDNRAIDAAAVRNVADYIFDGGCTGLFVAGGVGEGAWLSNAQRAALVQSSVEGARGRGPVLVGCMLPGTAPAREAAIQAADLGADAIVAGMPYYFAPVDSAAQQRHIESLLQATPLPVLLYNIPQCTHAPLAVDAVEALSREERVLGIKDSWGNLAFFQALLTIKQQRPSFRVLQGMESASMPSLLLGGDGLVPGLGNVAPRVCVNLVRAAQAGDLERCRELHAQIMRLSQMYTAAGGILALYAGCSLLGLCKNVPAEPWAPIEGSQLDLVRATLNRDALEPRAVSA